LHRNSRADVRGGGTARKGSTFMAAPRTWHYTARHKNNFHGRSEHEMDSLLLRDSRRGMREFAAPGQSIGSGCGSARRGRKPRSSCTRTGRS
jgi:hypothetical protein